MTTVVEDGDASRLVDHSRRKNGRRAPRLDEQGREDQQDRKTRARATRPSCAPSAAHLSHTQATARTRRKPSAFVLVVVL